MIRKGQHYHFIHKFDRFVSNMGSNMTQTERELKCVATEREISDKEGSRMRVAQAELVFEFSVTLCVNWFWRLMHRPEKSVCRFSVEGLDSCPPPMGWNFSNKHRPIYSCVPTVCPYGPSVTLSLSLFLSDIMNYIAKGTNMKMHARGRFVRFITAMLCIHPGCDATKNVYSLHHSRYRGREIKY